MNRVTLLTIALAITAAGCEDDKPTEYRYAFHFEKGSSLPDGASLYLGDEKLGTVRHQEGRFAGDSDQAKVGFTVPAAKMLGEDADKLAIRFQTPCGLSKPVRVEVEGFKKREAEWRAGSLPNISFDAQLSGEPKFPRAMRFWVDRTGGSEIRVGKAKLQGKSTSLFDVACADEHVLKVDGKEVGKISATGVVAAEGAKLDALAADRKAAASHRDHRAKFSKVPIPDAHVFIGQADACYRWEHVVYSGAEAGTKGGVSVLSGQQVYQLRGAPRYFLERAPQQKSGGDGMTLTELVRIDCKTK